MSVVGPLKLYAKLLCGEEAAMGPGKAMVLDAIRKCGSITAAGRDLGMSYRRTWLLIDTMNRCWRSPLVETLPGRSGSRLTTVGESVLAAYRALERRIDRAAIEDDYILLVQQLRPQPLPPSAPSHPEHRRS